MNKKLYAYLFCFCSIFAFSQTNKYFNKGLLFYNKSEIDSSIFYFEKFKKEQNKLNDSTKASLHFYLAKSYKLKQNYDKALENYVVAERIFKKTKKYNELTEVYVSIAEFYRAKYDLISAEKYLEIAKQLINSKNITEKVIAYYWNRKAAIYVEKDDDFINSIKCSEKVIKIAQNLKDKELEASSLNEIGYAYENLKNPIAEKFYKESLKIYKSINDKIYTVNVLNNIVRLYDKRNEIDKAKSYIDEGYKIAVSNKINRDIRNFYQSYYLYYQKKQDYKQALFYHIKARKLEKEEFVNKWNKQIIDSERKYELGRKDQQIEVNRISLLNQKKELKSSKKLIVTSKALLLVSLIFILVIIYFYRKISKANGKLKFLSEQNEFLLSEANHRINNNLQLVIILISNQLKKLPKKKQFEIKKILSKVDSIATLHRHLYQSKDKSEVDCKKYLTDIKISFFELFKENNIQTNFIIQNIHLQTDIAMYLGLLLTELSINSIKHAFKEDDVKVINFELTKQDELISFNYNDNGTTLQGEAIKPILIDKLCRQLKIEYSISTSNGFSFTFIKQIN